MANLNRVFLIGNLTRDPETRATQSGMTVVHFTLAVNTYRKKDKDDEVLFAPVTFFGSQAETLVNSVRKGDPLFVEGRLKQERWENSEGESRQRTVVIGSSFQFLAPKPINPPYENTSYYKGKQDDEPPF